MLELDQCVPEAKACSVQTLFWILNCGEGERDLASGWLTILPPGGIKLPFMEEGLWVAGLTRS